LDADDARHRSCCHRDLPPQPWLEIRAVGQGWTDASPATFGIDAAD